MKWKPSKRQALLKKRLINSSQTYWQTSRQLDQMLLKMLHSDGIYTPDDLHNWYIKSHSDPKAGWDISLKSSHHQQIHNRKMVNDRLDHALNNLSLALNQLKTVIDKRYP